MKTKQDIPKVSVIIPVYNSGRFLEESLNSILNQSFNNFEIIIIDNGSIDNSRDIEDKYKRKDKRIYIKKFSRPNVQKALNEGLKIARGKYIARMDADDIFLKDRFKLQVDYLDKHPEIYLIGGSAIVIDENGEKMGSLLKGDNYKRIQKKLLKSNPLIHPSIMFRNTKEFFYRDKFVCSEDYDLYLRMLTNGKKLENIPNFLIKYRISRNSFVSTMPHQLFYFNKAKEFYFQREKFGKDDYENLKLPLKEQKQQSFDKLNLQIRIFAELQDNRSKEIRKNIKIYFKKYGINIQMILYYILSFFPIKVIKFIQRNIF